MKRGTKLALLTAAVLLALGAACCGIALSAVDFEFRRLSTDGGGLQETLHETFAPETVRQIVVETGTDGLQIRHSEDGRIHLQYTQRERQQYALSEDGGVLTLRQSSKQGWSGLQWFSVRFGAEEQDVILELPEGFAGDLQILSEVGDVELQSPLQLRGALDCSLETGSFRAGSLEAGSVTVETEIGEIDGTDWSAADVALSAETGGITLAGGAVNGTLSCRTEIGEIRLSGLTAGALEASAETGDVTVDQVSAEKIELETELGSISGTLEGAESDYTIDARTELGDCTLRDRAGRTGRTLQAVTETGDIDLSFTHP